MLIFGPQGSGKGTQAQRLARARGLAHVSTGDILRSAIAAQTEFGRRVGPIVDRGDLVPDELMIGLIRERLELEDGFILDGFPRTIPQADALAAMLAEIGKPVDAVILLEVSDHVAAERLHARAVSEGRADDSPDAIRHRLALYHQLTVPLLERYREDGTLVVVNGEGAVDEVASAIEEALSGVGARTA